MSRDIHPEIRHHKVADLIKRYHVADVEQHRALSDAMQEQALYQIMCKDVFPRRLVRAYWILFFPDILLVN